MIAPAWVGLEGPLGANKTRLVQGIAEGVGYAGRVRSPTFVLENRYLGAVPLLHQDLYRLDDPGEDLIADWDEHPGLVLVEWAERSDERPYRWVRVHLDPESEQVRRVRISWDESIGVLCEEDLPGGRGADAPGGAGAPLR
ncbi:MAG: tRNA (adenosine(37)-N6)-threonylcarbamoyltransferase complex ATPase subunit type 1 TsaE [Candidatus Eisenbacteria bacterium]